ncbi:hypothetical protein B9Z55_025236 [Caenorhabditis nigoni]|uniref:TAFII55 protein conserved region domain-containing protein n=1 Tax=Caenorhabditis nigoni TaxID=1611254 RepID=A0A2G5SXY6_9PELO|nr:hypothetical protein B9Z55_025236 [Caenorhabditis nigoni]
MSKSKKNHKIDDQEEWENHLVLRVPDRFVDRIEKIVNDEPGAEKLAIGVNDDNRSVELRLGREILNATIMDLPTITEVHKTIDNKIIHKVTDVCQMIVADELIPAPKSKKKNKKKKKQTENGEMDNLSPAEKEPEPSAPGPSAAPSAAPRQSAKKMFQFPHGLTPPMRNCRNRRFRKQKAKKTMDTDEIETELKRLLRADLEADSIRWEIVQDNGQDEEEEEASPEKDDVDDVDNDQSSK